MQWELLISALSILVTILIFIITTFDRRVKKVDAEYKRLDERLRNAEGQMIEVRTENEQIIKRLDRIETKIDDLVVTLRK